MEIEVKYRPVNSLACVRLADGEHIEAEPGAMVGMSTSVKMDTGMRSSGSSGGGGGLLGKIASAAKSMVSGESFFTNKFTALGGTGEVLLAPSLSGDIVTLEVPQSGITMQSGAYIANSNGTRVDAQVGGFKTMFAGEGLFVLEAKASNPGEQVILGAYGGIEEMQVDGSMIVDTGHLVAWESNLRLDVRNASSSWWSSFLSGEGRVTNLSGQGRIWVQTRQPIEFGQTIGHMLPPRK